MRKMAACDSDEMFRGGKKKAQIKKRKHLEFGLSVNEFAFMKFQFHRWQQHLLNLCSCSARPTDLKTTGITKNAKVATVPKMLPI